MPALCRKPHSLSPVRSGQRPTVFYTQQPKRSSKHKFTAPLYYLSFSKSSSTLISESSYGVEVKRTSGIMRTNSYAGGIYVFIVLPPLCSFVGFVKDRINVFFICGVRIAAGCRLITHSMTCNVFNRATGSNRFYCQYGKIEIHSNVFVGGAVRSCTV